MTVPATTRKAGPYTGTGVQTVFPFSFKVFAITDVKVVVANTAGVESTLSSGYTVTANADQVASPGGSVTLSAALASGYKLTLLGNLPYDQTLALPGGGNFNPVAVENALDRIVEQVQQISEAGSRVLALPATANASGTLPAPAANKVIGWNATGDALQNLDPSVLATVVAYGTANSDIFTGTGAQTTFVLSNSPGALNNLDVSVGGVTQLPGVDYTWTTGTTVTFTAAPPLGAKVLIRYMQALSLGTADAGSVQYTPAGAVATTVQAQLRNIQAWNLLVKDAPYYAMGLGLGDDTAAINAALTAAGSLAYKKTVLVPAGEYILTAPLVVPVGVSLIGEGRGWFTTSYAYLSGTVFRKNHNGNCVSVTGSGGNNDIAGMLQGFCVVSDAATYTTGAGIYIDGVQQAIVRDVTVSRCGGDSFVFGNTGTANFTTYVTAENCYANTAGTGKAFAINSKWVRVKQCISDGGAYGFYLGTSAQEGFYEDIHCEFVTNTGIYLTGAGRNKFSKPFIGITAAGSYGIYCANVSGTYYNKFDNAHVLAANTAGQIAFQNSGGQNIFNTLVDSAIESFDTGYKDLGGNNVCESTSFYNVKFPMVMGSSASTLNKNTTQNTAAAGGTWAINHTGGTTGNWTDNFLDGSNANGLINPGVTGVIGNFSGIRASRNIGFVSRSTGQTGAITSGSTITHGLAGAPGTGSSAGIVLTSYTGGVTSQFQVTSPTSTTFTVSWAGTTNVQIGWVASLACDF